MPTNYATFGHVQIANVTINGASGQPGSTLSWTFFNGYANTDSFITDQDSDGNLDAGSDEYQFPGITFTGYTITSGGVEYGIFIDPTWGDYYIPLPTNAVGQSIVPNSGTSNSYQAEATGNVFLCFVGGTLIATPGGERLVEDLAIGDLVRTADGRDVPVRWIGRKSVVSHVNLHHDEKYAPVCITAGALGNHSDLYVSADHGMIVSASNSQAADDQDDWLVINASSLVNGTTIRFVPVSELPANFTYYHIETEEHDVIIANGALSETFLDAITRSHFENYQEYLALYGAERIIMEMNRPRIASQRLVPDDIKARLAGPQGNVPKASNAA